ncbi:hypothetical protein [Caulobacter sp. NIBR1757]|uniref:hypothetical protein n=1 Tax=Caulobacter sp. NIBR1757 TaxID=3016000 RepID=UPI0022F11D10|nr:hypothetical protein [Caulobacter sp. NIBR1757]WGM39709.1 hypothetical protein AMEJIAPC_02635 [Caulobacter sp. NIBR1757]
MRLAFITAAALLVAGPALAQTPAAMPGKPLFPNPADANKDGVVTDDERLDYQAAQHDKRPVREIGVAAPKSSGDGVTFKLTEPENELDKRAVKASSFEEAQNAQASKAEAKKKND